MTHDKDFMAIALNRARLGLGRTSPNPMVGAVIVRKGRVLAKGFHKKAGGPHAEIEAIRALHDGVGAPFMAPGRGKPRPYKDTTLYVTLEPCCHYGRMPPCTEAIIQSGIKEVVIGMRDPDKKVSGKGIRILKRNGIRVRVGILQKECERLNQAYIKHRRTGLPFVILKLASTLDGKFVSAKGEGDSPKPRWITGFEARAYGHQIRDQVDAILVGINTVIADNPRLTTRLPQRKGDSPKGKDPVRIILDSSLRIKTTAKILNLKSSSPTVIATTISGEKNRKKMALLQKKPGIEILLCKSDQTGQVEGKAPAALPTEGATRAPMIALEDLLKKLGKRGVMSLLVEGGPTVAASFLRQGLVDKCLFFVAPKMGGLGDLNSVFTRQLGQDVLIEADVSTPRF